MFIHIHLKYGMLDSSFSNQSTDNQIPDPCWQELLDCYLCLVKSVTLSLPTLWRHCKERNIAPLILNLGTRRRWVVSVTLRPLYPRERTPEPTGGLHIPHFRAVVCGISENVLTFHIVWKLIRRQNWRAGGIYYPVAGNVQFCVAEMSAWLQGTWM